MIAGLLAYVDGDDTLDVWRTSLVAAALLGAVTAVIVLAHAPRLPDAAGRAVLGIGAVLAVAGLAVVVERTEHVADLRLNGWLVTEAVAEVDSLVPPGAPRRGAARAQSSQDPVVKWVPQRQRYQLYQLYLPERIVPPGPGCRRRRRPVRVRPAVGPRARRRRRHGDLDAIPAHGSRSGRSRTG